LAAFKAGSAVLRKPQFDIDYEQAKKLKFIADKYGCCVIVVAHTRKADADDVYDTVSGTLGLNAVADTIAILQHQRGGDTGKLHVTGRDVQDEQFGLLFESGRWRIVDSNEQETESTRDKVLRALRQWGPIRAKELHNLLAATGLGFDALRQTLRRLAADGYVSQDEFGNYSVAAHTQTTTNESHNTHTHVTLSHCHTVTLSHACDSVTRDTPPKNWDERHANRVLAALRHGPATITELSDRLALESWQVRRGLMRLVEGGAAQFVEGRWQVVPEAPATPSEQAPATLEPPTDDPQAAAVWRAVAEWVLDQLKSAPATLQQLNRSCPIADSEYPLQLVVRDLCTIGLVVGARDGFRLTEHGLAVANENNGSADRQQVLPD